MLAADPTAGDQPEIRRFLTGPLGCEVTGVITTPDSRTMLVNIQHPQGTWPQSYGLSTPRSSTVIVTNDDGGVIGT